jgi:hypothetical protein
MQIESWGSQYWFYRIPPDIFKKVSQKKNQRHGLILLRLPEPALPGIY